MEECGRKGDFWWGLSPMRGLRGCSALGHRLLLLGREKGPITGTPPRGAWVGHTKLRVKPQ